MTNREHAQEYATPPEELIDRNRGRIHGLMNELGYSKVKALEDLSLTEEQQKKIISIKLRMVNQTSLDFYKGTRPDGNEAKAIIQAFPNRYVAAEVFSSGLVGGHACNNDFIWDAELQPILEEAIRGKARE